MCLGCQHDLRIDVWFLLDFSWSINSNDFQRALEFVTEVTAQFNVTGNTVQLGFSYQFETHETRLNFDSSSTLASFNSTVTSTNRPDSELVSSFILQ